MTQLELQIRTTLSTAGLRATKQRMALLQELTQTKKPRSAEALRQALTGSLDLTTVYRALDQLTAVGLVRRVELRTNSALYELADEHHHHLTCTVCGVVEDVEVCIPNNVLQNAQKSTGFSRIDAHALELFGTCRSCV